MSGTIGAGVLEPGDLNRVTELMWRGTDGCGSLVSRWGLDPAMRHTLSTGEHFLLVHPLRLGERPI